MYDLAKRLRIDICGSLQVFQKPVPRSRRVIGKPVVRSSVDSFFIGYKGHTVAGERFGAYWTQADDAFDHSY